MADSAAQPVTRFKYTPLDPTVPSIRLLTLFPDQEGDQIRCNLTSYVWDPVSGDIDNGRLNSIEGVSGHDQQLDQPPVDESSDQSKFATYINALCPQTVILNAFR